VSSSRPAWHLAAVLAAAVLVMHAPVLVAGKTWAEPAYLGQVVPARLAAGEAIARGELPAWWTGTGLGVPMAAAPHHGALYPPHWLPALVPAHALAVLDGILLLHLWWAALGVALWSRRLGADDLGAVAAGAAFAACGVAGAGVIGGAIVAIAQLPWIGWAADRLGMAAPPRGRARAAAIVALLLGAVLLTGQLAIAIDAAILAVAVAASRARRLPVVAGWTAVALVTGALLGAVQLVPALLHLTGDVAGVADAEAPRWLGLLVPGAGAPFVGLPLIVLAVVAALGGERRAGAAALAVAAAGVLLAVAWPRTGLAGDPALHVAAATAAAAALAGVGFSQLAGARPDGATLAVIGGAVVAASVAALSAPGAPAVIAVVAGTAALLALIAAGSRGLAAGGPLAAALLVGHPVALEHDRPRIDRERVAAPPALLAPATSTPGARVYRPRHLDDDDPDPGRRAAVDHDTGAGDTAARFGLASAQSSDPARRAVEDAAWRASGVAGGRLFDRYGIDWAVLPASVTTPADLRVAARHGRWALVEVAPARPPAFVAPRWRSAPSAPDAVDAIFPAAGPGLPLDEVVVIGGGSGGPAERTPVPPCDVARPASDRVVLDCNGPVGGIAIVLDAWAPGWSVTVDGAPAPALVADALVRAVRVEPGRHRVVWTYRTPGLGLGAALSAVAAAGLLVLWLALSVRPWLAARRRATVGG
jgi:hypothetical protein